MKRPKIICHMLTSINGKISGGYMSSKYATSGSMAYEITNNAYQSQAWLCDRVTMEKNFTDFHKPVLKKLQHLTLEPIMLHKKMQKCILFQQSLQVKLVGQLIQFNMKIVRKPTLSK
ncbi:hypothetical protein [Enterococcus sp. AZ177]|uniref:hypothetical protein n=1 Tax=unclassified Enterococcus TaxID=2608891 RepID=UPI003D2FDB3D